MKILQGHLELYILQTQYSTQTRPLASGRPVIDLPANAGSNMPAEQLSEREQRAMARERRQSGVVGGFPMPPPLPPASVRAPPVRIAEVSHLLLLCLMLLTLWGDGKFP